MASSKKKQRTKEDADADALRRGSVFLNPLFAQSQVEKAGRQVARNVAFRISNAEKLWFIAGTIFVALCLLTLRAIFGQWLFFYLFTSWYFLPVWSIVLGYQIRKLANMSPLRRETGEGSKTWLFLVIGRIVARIERKLLPKRVQYTKVIVHKHGGRDREPRAVDGILYLGTAPVPFSHLGEREPVLAIAGRRVWDQTPEYYETLYLRGTKFSNSIRGEFVPH